MKIKIGYMYLHSTSSIGYYIDRGCRIKKTHKKGKLQVRSNLGNRKMGEILEFVITNKFLYSKICFDEGIVLGHYRMIPTKKFNKEWIFKPNYGVVYKINLYYPVPIRHFLSRTQFIADIARKYYCINGILSWGTRKSDKAIKKELLEEDEQS